MIEPMTGLSEILQYNDNQESTVKILVDKSWLRIYPRPTTFMRS